MGFECATCHKLATGDDLYYRHLAVSYGPCETCGEHQECGNCQCSGDWAMAGLEAALRRRARAAQQQEVAVAVDRLRSATESLVRHEIAADLRQLHHELLEEG